MMRITITRSGLAAIGRRGFQEVGRNAIAAAGLYWWTKYLPLHFSNVAYLRYRYTTRDRRVEKLKRDRKPWPFGEHTEPAIGEVKPLVWSGRSRETALSHPNINATAKNFQTYRADVVIDARAFNFGAGKRINMRDEVTRTTAQEEKTLENVFAAEWERQLIAKGLQAPKRVRRTAA
jgi:hypothetical protein